MKTITITLHYTDNCGSSLQAFALQHFLLKNGIQNEIVDYEPSYIKCNGKPLRFFLRKVFYLKSSINREIKFKQFTNKYLILTDRKWKDYAHLKINPPIADCYITGSDQLWNTMYLCGKDPAYYLSFVQGKKIAYAVSVGRHVIPDNNKEMIRENVVDFTWISMRELSSVSQIKEIVNCPVDYTCDPVLLNDEEDYDVIKEERVVNGPYILVYLAQNIDKDNLNQIIGESCKHYKGKVVLVGGYLTRCNCDIHLRDVSPGEFLSLIYYADYIISNSFHATAFSLLYSKQFVTIPPKENGERIISLLHLVKLDKQCIEDGHFTFHTITDSKYETVKEILHRFSEASQKKLLHAILGDELSRMANISDFSWSVNKKLVIDTEKTT